MSKTFFYRMIVIVLIQVILLNSMLTLLFLKKAGIEIKLLNYFKIAREEDRKEQERKEQDPEKIASPAHSKEAQISKGSEHEEIGTEDKMLIEKLEGRLLKEKERRSVIKMNESVE